MVHSQTLRFEVVSVGGIYGMYVPSLCGREEHGGVLKVFQRSSDKHLHSHILHTTHVVVVVFVAVWGGK